MARFVPQPHHCAGAPHFVNGGILATLIDCHCVCTAYAAGYRDAGRVIGTAPAIHFVTGEMSLRYLRPAPIAGLLELSAAIAGRSDKGYRVSCTLQVQGKTCVSAHVFAAQVSEAWMKQNE